MGLFKKTTKVFDSLNMESSTICNDSHNCANCIHRVCKKVNKNVFVDYCEIDKCVFASVENALSLDFSNNRSKYPDDNTCKRWEYGVSSTWGVELFKESMSYMGIVDNPDDIPKMYKCNSSVAPKVGQYFIDRGRGYKFYVITSTDPIAWCEINSDRSILV